MADLLPETYSYDRGINNLPDEVLDYILSLLAPYNDLKQCMLVCKRWHRIAQNVLHHRKQNFHRSISNFDIEWTILTVPVKAHTITQRYAHSACRHGNYMYVFGGCTCMSTTFNDLWRLDLSTRHWERLLTMGSYPSPKALATMVHYKDSLILLGGWSQPSPYPLHQAMKIFNELHVYSLSNNRWSEVPHLTTEPPILCGHSATIHRDTMVVFGGMHGDRSSNAVWRFDLLTFTWSKLPTPALAAEPQPRYGQTQIFLDDDHLLIVGGNGGRPHQVLNDVWLLTMTMPIWQWQQVTLRNPQWAASNLWRYPSCRVGNSLVVISRHPTSYSKWGKFRLLSESGQNDEAFIPRLAAANSRDLATRAVDRDVNVNGRRGSLGRSRQEADQQEAPAPTNAIADQPSRLQDCSVPCKLNRDGPHLNIITSMAAFKDNCPQAVSPPRSRERQLEALRRMEVRYKQVTSAPVPAPTRPVNTRMAVYVMDLAGVLTDECFATWLPLRSVAEGSPEDTILYSLVLGNGELIMFGGITKDETRQPFINTVCNSLCFITAPRSII